MYQKELVCANLLCFDLVSPDPEVGFGEGVTGKIMGSQVAAKEADTASGTYKPYKI